LLDFAAETSRVAARFLLAAMLMEWRIAIPIDGFKLMQR